MLREISLTMVGPEAACDLPSFVNNAALEYMEYMENGSDIHDFIKRLSQLHGIAPLSLTRIRIVFYEKFASVFDPQLESLWNEVDHAFEDPRLQNVKRVELVFWGPVDQNEVPTTLAPMLPSSYHRQILYCSS
ncbi:hypothetical protein NLI96_g872 [Meripilus lineatus]|uniref:Uncharacterized protein n=1 Tax=Meripilus lineatus TaxID=2056292 RepID=A0AAD5VBJ0_9APHY|nr:hypothetical protein NLI96_g872 [Physisporinus lineatus]